MFGLKYLKSKSKFGISCVQSKTTVPTIRCFAVSHKRRPIGAIFFCNFEKVALFMKRMLDTKEAETLGYRFMSIYPKDIL